MLEAPFAYFDDSRTGARRAPSALTIATCASSIFLVGPGCACEVRVTPPRFLSLERLLQQGVDQARVRPPFRPPHHLAHEPAEAGRLAAAVGRDLVRARSQDLADRRHDRPLVGNLGEPVA